jgi:hypothetical protein
VRLTNRAKPTVSDVFRFQLHVDVIFPPVPFKKVLKSHNLLPHPPPPTPHTSVLSGSEIKPQYLILLNEGTKKCFLIAAKILKIYEILPLPASQKSLTICCLFQRTQIRGMCDASNLIWKNQQV